jgi:O-antigen ligase
LFVALVWVTNPRNLQDLTGRIDGVFNAIENPDPGPVCEPTDQACVEANPGDREVRVLLFQQALRLWTGEPIFGYGVGQFGGVVAFRNDPDWYHDPRFGPDGFKLYGLIGTQVDSFWMHLVIETGAAGLIAYLVWLGSVAWRPARAARQWAKRPRAPSDEAAADHAMLIWAAPAVVFGVAVSALSPALEDHLLPPLMFAMVGLGWIAAARQATDSYSAEIRRADSDSE